jgi:predicted metalloprotease
MTFDPNARLDPGQITDRRGRGGRTGVAIGGGGLGLVLVIAYVLLGGNPDDLSGVLQPGAVTGPESSALATECKTGTDANERDDCRILGFVNSVQTYWTGEFQASNLQYEPVDTVLFSDATQSACGTATAASGPFYCPADTLVYLDLGFFEDLRTRFGATGGSLAQGYVVAHEYGHHVQDLLGTLARAQEGSGPEGGSVRTELQADCLAGVWANHAVEGGLITELTQADINSGIDAAGAVGDDRIQERTQGQVDPESWTHGSSEQRRRWFSRGYETGNAARCDTFTGSI